MDFRGTYEFNATPERVFEALTNPTSVAGCIPGCDTLEPLGGDRYRATMTLGVAAIKGRFRGTVALREMDPPSAFVMRVDGKGSAGFATGEARIEVSASDSGSSVAVSAKARVGGTVARVGQRLLAGTAKMITDKFFSCLRERVESAD